MRLPGAFDNEQTTVLKAIIGAADLDPVDVYALPVTGYPDGIPVIHLAPAPNTARRLQELYDFPDTIDHGTLGQYNASDPEYRLTLRGRSDGEPLWLVGTFDVRTQPAAVALLKRLIRLQKFPDLLRRLVALEPVTAR